MTNTGRVASAQELLDLLEAITEVRVRNPELRASVLAALRLSMGEGLLEAGSLYTLRFDGMISAIICHGKLTLDEEDQRRLVSESVAQRSLLQRGNLQVWPLGTDRRYYAVLIIQAGDPQVVALLAQLFFQWSAVAEFTNLERAELLDENTQLREEIKTQFSERNIIGVSGAFRRVIEGARKVAASAATVLIHGETGTGKEIIARLIHQHSPRCNGPFVTVNCGALNESLLETELFGHVKGAFTGAVADHKGRFEAAHGGSIFLDEIGEISPAMQVRLLRVLQEMEIVRVGETTSRKLDVRVIAATNRDLEAMMQEGSFRSDLFYRLNVVYLHIPPIRNRREDIPPLVEHFLSEYCRRNCKFVEALDREVLERMMAYPWPGNVRELENCIEKMVVMSNGRQLTAELLPMAIMAYQGQGPLPQPTREPETVAGPPEDSFHSTLSAHIEALAEDEDLYEQLRARWERHVFAIMLERCNHNKTQVARQLGISRNMLNARLNAVSEIKRSWLV